MSTMDQAPEQVEQVEQVEQQAGQADQLQGEFKRLVLEAN